MKCTEPRFGSANGMDEHRRHEAMLVLRQIGEYRLLCCTDGTRRAQQEATNGNQRDEDHEQ